MHLDFCFDQLPHTLMKSRAEGVRKKRGDRERGQKFFVLFISRKNIVSLLVWHFQWKYSISAGQNARMFYLMEFPTQEWKSSSYCRGCLSS